MNRRVAMAATGALMMLAAILAQLHRFTADAVPPRANPLLWLLTLGCLSGGAWLLATARTSASTADHLDAEQTHQPTPPAPRASVVGRPGS